MSEAQPIIARQALLGAQDQRLLDTVSLIGDLGGGWSVSQLDAK